MMTCQRCRIALTTPTEIRLRLCDECQVKAAIIEMERQCADARGTRREQTLVQEIDRLSRRQR